MSKVLTKEATIHLATKVDDMKPVYADNNNNVIGLYIKDIEDSIPLSRYSPNDPDSPYCMKYLRGILKNIKGEAKYWVHDVYPPKVMGDLDTEVKKVLGCTGFKGEVWK